ncbi:MULTISPECIES: hypothetical protein [unclassified Streptomyces]|uniref:hypothetical protein n=1 Tax=unclassified Streptomyces TaxID=2593676 RepID=UPI0013B86466|nr:MULTISPECIES: hypothetical protein [unclassified Streptomyces]NDZ90924.1 hypothetical protein [Streptomyces sp. SID10115]NDZ97743.1 hypothetical protein [Streptomyces sp. SID10116]NEB46598.1 hypothetical protein [Streptomyces sp. SID339]
MSHRFSSAAGIRDWSYWLDTFNVAHGPVDPHVFLTGPTVPVDECGPVRWSSVVRGRSDGRARSSVSTGQPGR